MNRILQVAKEYLDDFVNLFFPQVCLNCNTILIYQEQHICTKCRLSLPKTNYHQQPENHVFQKFAFEPKVTKAAAYLHFNKRGIAQKMIHELKYRNQPSVGNMLGLWYGAVLKQAGWNPDVIVPVPIHSSKKRKRGYNQSDYFGEGLSSAFGCSLETGWVIRSKKTISQTKKAKVDRWENISEVYAMTDTAAFQGKKVMVVDDVVTTGATIGELVSLLAQNGVGEIHIVTIAAGK